MDDLIEKIYSRLLEIDEIEEASTLAGGAITGVTTPLGAGPRGPVTYKDSDSTDRKHRKKSKKSKKIYINKSPQYYLKHGGEKSRKRSLKEIFLDK